MAQKQSRRSPPADSSVQKPAAVKLQRNFIAPDDRVLAAVSVDFSTLVVLPDGVVHSLYQTRLPVDGDVAGKTQIDSALVGRFQYGPEHFKALVALFIRQFRVFESSQGRVAEAQEFLQEHVRRNTR